MNERRKSGSAFAGFPQDAFRFLAGLKANNSREWFAENRQRYETGLKLPAEAFAAALCDELEKLTGAAHDAKIFRIHRDVRFSKDKTPYNAHLHISFLPQTDYPSPPAWHFGLHPDRLSIGAGVFTFDKTILQAYRQRLDDGNGAVLETILNTLCEADFRISELDLKRVPPPFAPDHRHAQLLRHKGLTAWLDFDDLHWLMQPSVIAECTAYFSKLRPLFDRLLALK
jgi:uncharacterized protein (TIGR02453 family)